jgi:hypothetical protein
MEGVDPKVPPELEGEKLPAAFGVRPPGAVCRNASPSAYGRIGALRHGTGDFRYPELRKGASISAV